jgi:hypothetical protein
MHLGKKDWVGLVFMGGLVGMAIGLACVKEITQSMLRKNVR